MHCPNCGTENRARAKFCDECAAPLLQVCLSCNAENRPEAKFCSECATPLARRPQAQSAKSKVYNSSDPRLQTLDPKPVSYTPKHLAERILAEQAAMAARGAFAGERKFITALFADMKNSMDLIEDLDPEEARAIVDPVLQLMMDAVHRYDGYVSQSMGDGIFALFGAPIACEDHSQRAIFAALRMQEESRRYAEMLRREQGINMQIRVGLNSGEVVVRSIHKDDLHTDYTPVGHATSLAARMESLATPGSILVSAYTYQLAEGYFEFKLLGPARIKGVSAPLDIYEVLGPGPLRTRLQVAAQRGLARFIGRQQELRQLQQALDRAKNGQGGVVGVRGAPGVGKSRLFHEFKAMTNGCLVLETFSVSHGKAYAYLPLIELLKNYFHITALDDERRRRERITGKVLTLNRGLEDTLPYLFSLLGIEEPDSPLQQLDSHIRRRRTFGAIARLLFQESLNQPLILICEDLHWIDGETQAFLLSQTELIASARILLLVNYRPEYQQEWTDKPYFTQMQLEPLGQREAVEFLSFLLGEQSDVSQNAVLEMLKQQILTKTEGNPLFMEEIIRALVEQGMLIHDATGAKLLPIPTVNLASLHLPPTIQGVLAARIDRLPPDAKELLQILSTVGKECALNLLSRIVEYAEETLQRLLRKLQGAGFIYVQPTIGNATYTFVHALTQEVAYTSLLLERRRVLHERIAQEIEALFAQQLGAHYSELAHHYSQSGNTRKAITYLQLAGEQAVQRSANSEAINHFTTALQLLTTLPATAERDVQELALRLALGVPLVVTTGIAAPEVGEMYTRALALAEQSGDATRLFPVLRGLWEFHEVRGALATARSLGEQLLTLAQQTQDSTLLLVAHGALADTFLWHGDFTRAREHAEQGVAAYALAQHRSLAFLYGGHDLGVSSSLWQALALWQLGYPDQAVQSIHQTLPLLETLAHPYSTVHTLSFSAMLHQFLRQEGAVQDRVAAALILSQEQCFTQYVAMQMILHGWVLMEQGQEKKGVARMREGLDIWRETHAELLLPYYYALLAEGYGKIGRRDEGIALLDEALAKVREGAEQWWEAELYRLKGELLLSVSSPPE